MRVNPPRWSSHVRPEYIIYSFDLVRGRVGVVGCLVDERCCLNIHSMHAPRGWMLGIKRRDLNIYYSMLREVAWQIDRGSRSEHMYARKLSSVCTL